MGYISKPYMAKFPAMNSLAIVDNSGSQAWDTNLSNATDQNAATYAAVSAKIAIAETAKAKLDLGAVYNLGSVRSKIGMWANNNFATEVEITVLLRVSLNGSDWTTIDTFTDVDTLGDSTDVEVTDTVEIATDNLIARYIGLEFSVASTAGTDNEARIYELWADGHPVRTTPVI